jgi:IS5 family transposase
MVASCTPVDIPSPTDPKLLSEARDSSERIIDNLFDQHSDLCKHNPRVYRGRARTVFPSIVKQKSPRRRKMKFAMRRSRDDLRRNLDVIDALTVSAASLLGLNSHW